MNKERFFKLIMTIGGLSFVKILINFQLLPPQIVAIIMRITQLLDVSFDQVALEAGKRSYPARLATTGALEGRKTPFSSL
ncbi:MAG: hypothetical protein IJ205_07910 [Bacteroidales bacterium]|nr:hypothetical protein [Bacteroidales bacterium]